MSSTTFYNSQNLAGIGSVGIGTTNPVSPLQIQCADAYQGGITLSSAASNATGPMEYMIQRGLIGGNILGAGINTSNIMIFHTTNETTSPGGGKTGFVWMSSGTKVHMYFDTTNKTLGIGTTNPGYTLDVTGDIRATGDITAFSDRRVKSNLEKITGALDKVAAINGYTFTRTDSVSNERHAGVIAQEVQEVLPEVVSTDGTGHLSVAYGNITALLIEALKEEKNKREALEARIAALELRPIV